ncbi:MAG: hypothetical protein ACYCZR_15785 [Burkholderiales bacterium]
MAAANKAKGSLFERQLEEYIQGAGVKARRLPRAGSKDIGDVAIELKDGSVIVVEAKNVKTVTMADFLKQAEVEAVNFCDKYNVDTYPVVIVKARQQSVGQSRVTMTLDALLDLLHEKGLA